MKLARFFEAAVSAGRRRDPRIASGIPRYADSALLYGDGSREIHSVLVGIDIDVQELLLADRLRASGRVDCVLSHHPSGKAYAGLHTVMELQVELLARAGVERAAAKGFLEERKAEVERKISPQNHMRAVDAARLLDIPFCCVHTPADNCAAWFITRLCSAAKPEKLGDLLTALNAVDEYRQAAENCAGPRIVVGDPLKPAGKIFVEMTGGSSGPKDAYGLLQSAGISTLVSMNIGEEHRRKIAGLGLNAIAAGHISSDTLGMNLVLDEITREEPLEILCCSGFRRVAR